MISKLLMEFISRVSKTCSKHSPAKTKAIINQKKAENQIKESVPYIWQCSTKSKEEFLDETVNNNQVF